MKQRIRVSALCKRKDSVLLLKRAGGRVEGLSNFELPTGKIEFGEQPDEAMSRAIYECLGVQTEQLRLSDVITFSDLRDSTQLGNLYIIYDIELGEEEIKLESERYGAYKWVRRSEIENYVLDEASRMVLQITSSKSIGVSSPIIKASNSGRMPAASNGGYAVIYTDGGSRGNPGPSGLGYYILGPDGRELKRGGEFLGFTSSRLAEYYGLKEGIEQAIELGLKRVHFRSDSLMMVNQMNGVYKVKNKDLLQVHSDVWKLLGSLDSYSFSHVPREQNREADAEANKAMDQYSNRTEE